MLTSACKDQKCPASAFGDDGGLTYEFITKDLLTALKQMCKDRGEPTDIRFDWCRQSLRRVPGTEQDWHMQLHRRSHMRELRPGLRGWQYPRVSKHITAAVADFGLLQFQAGGRQASCAAT